MEKEKLRGAVVEKYGEAADSLRADVGRLAVLEAAATEAGFDKEALDAVTVSLETLATAHDCLLEARSLDDGTGRRPLRDHGESDVKAIAEKVRKEEGVELEDLRNERVSVMKGAFERMAEGGRSQ